MNDLIISKNKDEKNKKISPINYKKIEEQISKNNKIKIETDKDSKPIVNKIILLDKNNNKLKNVELIVIDFINLIYKKFLNIKKNKTYFKNISDKKIKENINKFNVLTNLTNDVYQFLIDIDNIPEIRNDYFQKKIAKFNSSVNAYLFKLLKEINKLKKFNNWEKLTTNNIVELKNVSKFYSSISLNTRVLNNISLEIKRGDFVVILGPSGSGKTTLMNLLSGIDSPTFGLINVNNYNLSKLSNSGLTKFRQDQIGYIFQKYGLLPNLTVYENVCMGLYLGKDNKKEEGENTVRISTQEKEKILEILKLVDMEKNVNKYPYELSGGQKQRVSIARTIAKDSPIIFGDEPTAAVDAELSDSIIKLFKMVNQLYKKTVIIITHDESIAKYANRTIYIKDGKIENVILKYEDCILQ